jgi:hypothetical protein
MHVESRLGFKAVWVDPAQDFERAFTLLYYPDDGDVELVRRTRARDVGAMMARGWPRGRRRDGDGTRATMTDDGHATPHRRLRIKRKRCFCGNARRKRRSSWMIYS